MAVYSASQLSCAAEVLAERFGVFLPFVNLARRFFSELFFAFRHASAWAQRIGALRPRFLTVGDWHGDLCPIVFCIRARFGALRPNLIAVGRILSFQTIIFRSKKCKNPSGYYVVSPITCL